MSGEQELKVQDRWNEFEKVISNYLNSLRFVTTNANTEDASIALNLTHDLIEKLSAQQCNEYAYSLDVYSFYLQQELNKHKSKLAWAKHNLDVTIGSRILNGNYGTAYTKYEEKRLIIIADNIYCKELNKMILECNGVIDNLEMLSNKVGVIAKTLKDIGNSKRYNHE